jgi:hypothetical protein
MRQAKKHKLFGGLSSFSGDFGLTMIEKLRDTALSFVMR